jgi:hypothetical protein
MEGLGIPEPKQPIEELSVAEEIKQRKEHQAALNEIIASKVQEIVSKNYSYTKDLESSIKDIIDQFKEKDQQELIDGFKQALINPVMLIIRNLELSQYTCPSVQGLFDDTIVKFNENIFPDLTEESRDLLITDLPQEVLAYILVLNISTVITENLKVFGALGIGECLEFITTISNVCKQFYLSKGILIDHLKKVADQKILNKALRTCALQGWNHLAEILICSKKVDLDEFGNYNTNALMNTIRSDNDELAKLLLYHGANTETKDRDGNTVLMFAIERCKPTFVQLLLEHKADLNAINHKGQSVLQLATEMYEHPNFSKQIRKTILELIKKAIQQIAEKEESGEKELQN